MSSFWSLFVNMFFYKIYFHETMVIVKPLTDVASNTIRNTEEPTILSQAIILSKAHGAAISMMAKGCIVA